MSSVTPSEVDILHDFYKTKTANLHTCMPGEVLKVHGGEHALQFVDVNLMLKRRVQDENGTWIVEGYPVVPMVPIGYQQAGGFLLSLPVKVGDIVLVHFAERSIDQWIEKARAGKRQQIDPGDIGQHVLEGAIAVPCGPASRPRLLASVHADNLVIGVDGGGQIHITPAGEIKLGGADAAEALVLGTTLKQKLDAIVAWMGAINEVLIGEPIPEPGSGSPSALQAKLALALSDPDPIPVPDTEGVLSIRHRIDQ